MADFICRLIDPSIFSCTPVAEAMLQMNVAATHIGIYQHNTHERLDMCGRMNKLLEFFMAEGRGHSKCQQNRTTKNPLQHYCSTAK